MAAYGTIAAETSKGRRQGPSSNVVEVVDDSHGGNGDEDEGQAMAKGYILATFYTSHGLFMWNNRSYEFASILFTASAFPHTLTGASVRGLSAHLASVVLSPSVGRWCGRHASRLRPVQVCIVVQRASILLACLGWILITHARDSPGLLEGEAKILVFGILIVLGMVERLSTVGNTIVVERDWLPLLANDVRETYSAIPVDAPDPQDPISDLDASPQVQESSPLVSPETQKLHNLNATTKRIDLITKLVAPLVVSAAAISLKSMPWTAVLLAALQIVTCGLELYLTTAVWTASSSLQAPKSALTVATCDTNLASEASPFMTSALAHVRSLLLGFKLYLGNQTCLPSLAYAIEPFSVLSMAGSMSAYLLVSHFPLTWITAARTASTTVEVASTILTPLLLTWLSKRPQAVRSKAERLGPLTVIGLAGLLWQVLFLIPATMTLLATSGSLSTTAVSSNKLQMIVLFTSLAISRLGPFAYTLVEQQLVQLEVADIERLEFSGIEMALIDLAELARWGMLGILGNPSNFRWAALLSLASVVLSVFLFAVWTRRQRHRVTP